MSLSKQTLAIVWKNLLLIKRNKKELLKDLIVPVIAAIIIYYTGIY